MKLFDKQQNVFLVKVSTYWSNPTAEIYEATIVKSNWLRSWTYTITYSNKESIVLIVEENPRFLFNNKKEAINFIKEELQSWLNNAESSINRYRWEVDIAIKRYEAIDNLLKQY